MNGMRKALPALILLLVPGLATTASADLSDDAVTTINGLEEQVFASLPQAAACNPGPYKTTYDRPFYWNVDGIRDPIESADYLLAHVERQSEKAKVNGVCKETVIKCQVTVLGSVTRPPDHVTFTWQTTLGADVEGTYRLLRFDGNAGSCSTTKVSFSGVMSVPVFLGYGNVAGTTI
jgi:hypothetical protein